MEPITQETLLARLPRRAADSNKGSYGTVAAFAGSRRYLGAPVLARLIRPLPDGRREVRGTLTGYENNVMTLDVDGGEPLTLEKAAVSKVRLLDDEDVDGGNS